MDLKSMKLPARTQESLVASADVPEGPRYPGGLSLHLDDDVLEKLSMTLPDVGKSFMLQARVHVTAASQMEYEGDKKRRAVSLQIVDMGLGTDEGEGSSAADKLYGGG